MAGKAAITSSNDSPDGLSDTGVASLDKVLGELDDDLNPIDPGNDPLTKKPVDKVEDDEPEKEEERAEELGEDEDEVAKKSKEDNQEKGGAAKKDKEPAEDEADEPYSIDEDEPAAAKVDTPDKPADVVPVASTEDQYVIDGIKDWAITVQGTVGDSADVKAYKVLSPTQLPAGFKYLDDSQHDQAFQAYNRIEQEAGRLHTQYTQTQAQKTNDDFTKREELGDRRDLAGLQKKGDIALFRKNPDIPAGFKGSLRDIVNLLADNNDEGAVIAKEVLDFKDKRNEQYMTEYNAGRPWKHIGFEEAFLMYQKQNPTKSNPAKVKEDKERKAYAKRTGSTRSGTTSKVTKPEVHSGATSRDLDAYIESLDDNL